jgi:hypothetical protein
MNKRSDNGSFITLNKKITFTRPLCVIKAMIPRFICNKNSHEAVIQ